MIPYLGADRILAALISCTETICRKASNERMYYMKGSILMGNDVVIRDVIVVVEQSARGRGPVRWGGRFYAPTSTLEQRLKLQSCDGHCQLVLEDGRKGHITIDSDFDATRYVASIVFEGVGPPPV